MAEITNVSPSAIPQGGGTTIVITGSGFKQATSVYIAAPNQKVCNVESYNIDSDTQITAVSPKLDYANYSYIYVAVDNERNRISIESPTPISLEVEIEAKYWNREVVDQIEQIAVLTKIPKPLIK